MKHPTSAAQDRAHKCLQHIAIGDAFGESFFGPTNSVREALANRVIPETSWEFTDDTIMSIAVYNCLRVKGSISPSFLATSFAHNYRLDPRRGYGATAGSMLRNPDFPTQWETMASKVFDGMGSMGNGAAMRTGPIGAYFFNDLEAVKKNARLSAIVTHANEEAVAGAEAVALATALATRVGNGATYTPTRFLESIVAEIGDTDTKAKINKSLSVPYGYTIKTVRSILGDGTRMLAQDTVPFAIWCAAYNLHDFEAALWKAVSILGDRDTICAIVAGIVGMSATADTVPDFWAKRVESIERRAFT